MEIFENINFWVMHIILILSGRGGFGSVVKAKNSIGNFL